MLTHNQLELLSFIKSRLDASGVPPSYDEMKDAMNLASKSGIHRMILALCERGFIRRIPDMARAIEIIIDPYDRGPADGWGARERVSEYLQVLVRENQELRRKIKALQGAA